MEIRKSDVVAGVAALLVAGPVGMVASPFVYRHLKANTKRPRLYWLLLGLVTLPVCWAPLIALLPPETPEQVAARTKAEKAEAQKEERRKFKEWANGMSPLIGCKTELKEQLRDPGSYQDDWAQPTPIIDEEKKTVSYVWSFRSKNGFGGYMDAAAACETVPDSSSSSSQWGGYGSPKAQIIQPQ